MHTAPGFRLVRRVGFLALLLLASMACQVVTGSVPQPTPTGPVSSILTLAPQGNTSPSQTAENQTQISNPASETPIAVAQSSEWTIAVISWGFYQSSTQAQPEPGKRLLLVDVILLNNSDQIQKDFSIHVADSTGATYDESYIFLAGDFYEGFYENGIFPGEHRRRSITFQVPETSKNLVFIFSPGGALADISIPIGQQSGTGSLPAEMTTYDRDVHALNEPFALGDLGVTVVGWQDQVINNPTGSQPSAYQLVSVDALVTNLSQDLVFGNDMGDLSIGVKDLTGRYYFEDTSAGSGFYQFKRQNRLALAPGETAAIRIYFDLPTEISRLEFYAEYHGPHQRLATFPQYAEVNLRAFLDPGTQPVEAGIPVQIAGEIAPRLHPQGESAQLGLFTIVVTGVKSESKPEGAFSIHTPGTLITVDYTAKYTGTPVAEYPETMQVGELSAFIKDDQGRYFLPHMSTYIQAPNAGETLNLESTFFLPGDSVDFYLVLQDFFFQKGFFALK